MDTNLWWLLSLTSFCSLFGSHSFEMKVILCAPLSHSQYLCKRNKHYAAFIILIRMVKSQDSQPNLVTKNRSHLLWQNIPRTGGFWQTYTTLTRSVRIDGLVYVPSLGTDIYVPSSYDIIGIKWDGAKLILNPLPHRLFNIHFLL